MNVTRVGSVPVKKENSSLKAAKRGALITSGVLTASTGIAWMTRKSEMQQVVKENGGKNKYAANFVIGLSVLSAAGALANTVLNGIMQKVSSEKSPKAAN